MVTKQDFINSLREKYPDAYTNVSDSALFDAVINKYPVYRDRISDINSTLPTELVTEDVEPAGRLDKINNDLSNLRRQQKQQQLDNEFSMIGKKVSNELRPLLKTQTTDPAGVTSTPSVPDEIIDSQPKLIPDEEKKPEKDILKIINNGNLAIDVAKDIDDAGKYATQRVFSEVLEKPAFALSNFVSRHTRGFLESLADDVGEDISDSPIIQAIAEAEEYYSRPESTGFITPIVTRERQKRRAEAAKNGFANLVTNDLLESGIDIGSLFASMGLLNKAYAVESAVGKLAQIGVHGFLTSRGNDEERFKNASRRIAYNLTPHMALATGARGIPATAIDAGLNILLSSKEYKEALSESGGKFDEKFWIKMIPTIATDIGFSLGTSKMRSNSNIPKSIMDKIKDGKLSKKEASDLTKITEIEKAISGEKPIDKKDKDIIKVKENISEKKNKENKKITKGKKIYKSKILKRKDGEKAERSSKIGTLPRLKKKESKLLPKKKEGSRLSSNKKKVSNRKTKSEIKTKPKITYFGESIGKTIRILKPKNKIESDKLAKEFIEYSRGLINVASNGKTKSLREFRKIDEKGFNSFIKNREKIVRDFISSKDPTKFNSFEYVNNISDKYLSKKYGDNKINLGVKDEIKKQTLKDLSWLRWARKYGTMQDKMLVRETVKRMHKSLLNKRKVNLIRPMQDAIDSFGDITMSRMFTNLRSIRERFVAKNNKLIESHEKILNKIDKNYTNTKTTRKVVEALELIRLGKTAEFDKLDDNIKLLAKSVDKYNRENIVPYVKATRVFLYLSGESKFKPANMTKEQEIKIRDKASEIFSDNNLSYHSKMEKFIDYVNEFNIGVRKGYVPTRHTDIDEERIINSYLDKSEPDRVLNELKSGIGTEYETKRFWNYKNKAYQYQSKLFADPYVKSIVERAAVYNKDNIKRLEPYVRSEFNSSKPFRTGEDIANRIINLRYKSILLRSSLKMYARQLAQNFAHITQSKSPVEALTELVTDPKKTLDYLSIIANPKKYINASNIKVFEDFSNHINGKSISGEYDFSVLNESRLGNLIKDNKVYRRLRKVSDALSKLPTEHADYINRVLMYRDFQPVVEKTTNDYVNGKITDTEVFNKLRLGLLTTTKRTILAELLKNDPEAFKKRVMSDKIFDVHLLYNKPDKSLFAQDNPLWSKVSTYQIARVEQLRRNIVNLFADKSLSSNQRINTFYHLANQSASETIRFLKNISPYLITGAYKLLQRDKMREEDKNILAMEIANNVQWLLPSTIANYAVEKVTGVQNNYGTNEFASIPLFAKNTFDSVANIVNSGAKSISDKDVIELIRTAEFAGNSFVPLFAFLSDGIGVAFRKRGAGITTMIETMIYSDPKSSEVYDKLSKSDKLKYINNYRNTIINLSDKVSQKLYSILAINNEKEKKTKGYFYPKSTGKVKIAMDLLFNRSSFYDKERLEDAKQKFLLYNSAVQMAKKAGDVKSANEFKKKANNYNDIYIELLKKTPTTLPKSLIIK